MSWKLTMARPLAFAVFVLLAGVSKGNATDPEQLVARQWLDRHLTKCELTAPSSIPVPVLPRPPEFGLDVYANNDPVILRARGNSPLKIGERTFSRGLYCHAVSKVVVHLPGPGKRFSALAGLDHNEDTARGRGSVVFSVTVGDKTVFRTDVMRFGTPAREVDVDLGGSRSFTLEIGDAGDGIGWDQSDWADAKVTLADGRELWLDELPLRDHRAEAAQAPIARRSLLPFSFVYGDQSSDDLLAAWTRETSTEKLDRSRTQYTLIWNDKSTGLEVRCVAVEYADYPAIEWTVYFKNSGSQSTPILRNIQGLDASLQRTAEGEEVRTPLIAMVFWKGEDTVRAQNIWRRWMLAHNVPRTADGKLPPPILFGNTSLQFHEMIHANEENQKYFIDRYLEEQIPIDYWWMDAGWYPCDGHWPNTGTWEPDLTRFPNELRAISDHALSKGVKTLVWFEPERVGGGWLSQNHPEWRLGPLLNLGKPETWRWLVDHIDGQIKTQGIHLYRQDFNMSPLSFWRGNDSADRQGITENLHIQGYLAYWDELRKRHPQLIIDSCASGGRRNDLETMRRAVPLHPTDYSYGDLAVKQAFHHSLHHWIPYFGSNTVPMDRPDAYAIRSGQSLSTTFGYDMRRKDFDYDQLRKLTEQLKRMVPCYYGDFYPLTPYSRDQKDWIAWQFHLSNQDEGMVQAFRRSECDASTHTFQLGGLDPAAKYRVHDLDQDKPITVSGRVLTDEGLLVSIPSHPGAVVLRYSRTE